MPHVILRSEGTDIWQGQLQDHPAALLVHIRAETPDECSVSLWRENDSGRNPVGYGRLFRQRGHWHGACSEGEARWEVSGVCGESRLEFRDPVEAVG